MNPVLELGALRLAAAIRGGEVSALDALEAHIAQAQATQQRLNVVTAWRLDAARAEARAIDARRAQGQVLPALAGVPITIKDSIDVAGLPSTFGLPWRRELLATCDDPHVARLRDQGAIVLAKSNVAQLLIYLESDNPLFGRSLHPERAERSPGGSSGGEAALVASLASAGGIGSDIGGSIRVPAHACGIVGFKPSMGRCEDGGRFSVPAGQLAFRSQLGPLARSVDDAELLLRAMQAGPAEGVPALGDSRAVALQGLRVGWIDDDGMFPAAPACRRAVREAAAALAKAGAQVQQLPGAPWPELYALAFRLMTADGGSAVRAMLRGGPAHASVRSIVLLAGLPAPLRLLLRGLLSACGQPSMAGFLALLGNTRVRQYWPLVEALLELRKRFAASLDAQAGGAIDAILSPPCSLPALRHGATRELGVAGAYSIAVNALGWPAGVIPWTRVRPDEESDRPLGRDRVFRLARSVELGSAGLPIGVQLIGRPWRDHQVFALMRALEAQGPRW